MASVTFPGLDDFQAIDFTFTPGITPSVCLVTTHASRATDLSDRGDLVLSQNGVTLRFPDCRVERPSIAVARGTTLRIPIKDRRWRWQFGEINGSYNVPQPDGGILREKSPRELASLLLDAMDEVGYDVSRLPNDTRPEVNWSYDNPARELDRLAESLGCIVNLNAADNTAELWPVGGSRGPLPSSKVKGGGASVSLAAKPKFLKVVGERTIFDGDFELVEAVGIETNGDIKPIDELSYTPPWGWRHVAHPTVISGFYTDPETGEQLSLRKLALDSVWRMYRIGTNGIVPQLLQNGPLAPQSLDDIELLPTRPHWVGGPAGHPRELPAIVTARFWDGDIAGKVGPPGSFSSGFRIDNARKLVIFGTQMFVSGNGEIRPFDKGPGVPATLTTGFHAGRDGVFHRYEKERDIAGESGVRVIRRAELQRRVVAGFGQDNVGRLDPIAEAALDSVQSEYDPQPSQTQNFAGWLPQATDGLVQQVTWSFSISAGSSTIVSAAAVHNPYVATVEQQRRALGA